MTQTFTGSTALKRFAALDHFFELFVFFLGLDHGCHNRGYEHGADEGCKQSQESKHGESPEKWMITPARSIVVHILSAGCELWKVRAVLSRLFAVKAEHDSDHSDNQHGPGCADDANFSRSRLFFFGKHVLVPYLRFQRAISDPVPRYC
ncbi:hypothetical protein RHIZ_05510 [Rhizobium skierniewicense]|nr:hypothetical protein [Rhizobium skierniewicense]MCI9865395.1 hypothetical protein [Rhizobium skierniewicense]